MAFGFGKKDNDSDGPSQGQANGQQISPEALALLEQLAAGQQPPQIQQVPVQQVPVQQVPVQQVPVQQVPVQQVPVQAPQMQQVPVADMQQGAMTAFAPQMAPAPNPSATQFTAPSMPDEMTDGDNQKSASGKKAGKSKPTRDEKRLAAKLAKEEKERNKRRKKLSKSRFSRARYLREANGNAVAGLSLWIFMIIVFVAGPFILNTQFLLPQTRENKDIVNKIAQLKNVIDRSKPQIESAVRNKTTSENEIKTRAASFPPSQNVTDAFTAFVDELKANDIAFDESAPAIVVPQDIGVTGLIGQRISLQMRGDFLTYLRIRNKFVNAQRSIRISNETIQAEPNDPTMSINVTISIPSKNS